MRKFVMDARQDDSELTADLSLCGISDLRHTPRPSTYLAVKKNRRMCYFSDG